MSLGEDIVRGDILDGANCRLGKRLKQEALEGARK